MSKVIKPVMSVKDVTFSYGANPILEHVTFDVKPGDYLGIVGPNGGGKTTLLKLMLGLLKPHKGEIFLLGEPIAHAQHRHRIGYVPQRLENDDHLFPATVEEVIQSGRTPLRRPLARWGREDTAAVKRAVKAAEIGHLLRRRFGTLSGGERQRVLIARALSGDPAILMLDEPTAAVDTPSQENFYTFLRKLHDQGLTIIIVSHDLDIVTHEVDIIVCLNKHLICHGPTEEVIRKSHLKDMVIMHQH